MAHRLLCVGDLNLDLVIAPEQRVVVGSDVAGTVAMSGGGSAANVAAWASRSGLAARFVGTVGDDPTGAFLVAELATHGVEVRPIVRPQTRTRTIAAIIEGDGDRSMVSDLDARLLLRPDDFDRAWLDDVDWLHITAYTYVDSTSQPMFTRLLAEARERGVRCSIDPSSAELLRTRCDLDDVRRAFTGVEVLFPNLDEARYLTGCDDDATAAESLLELAACVAVTCGADGAVIASRGRSTQRVPAVGVDVVNTLGAGDAFAAGFLAGLLQGSSTGDAAAMAAATAARAVARQTAR